MSEGPIKSWRDSWKPPEVSTKNNVRVCLVMVVERKTACGRKPVRGHQTANRDDVTCSECTAAMRADGGAP